MAPPIMEETAQGIPGVFALIDLLCRIGYIMDRIGK
jgi:hypothetical protein